MDNKILKNNTFSGKEVPKLTKMFFPWSGIFRDACYTLIGTFLIQYAITSGVLSTDLSAFKAQYGVITIAMIIALLWDGINDPIMGFILEKCHFKLGKFRPWIALGALGNALTVILMFVVPSLVGPNWGWGYVGFMIVMYILWDMFFTMNDIGYWSMLPALTSDPKERAKLTTQTSIAATIGTFTMNILMFVLPGTFSKFSTSNIYLVTSILTAILFLATQLTIFFVCKEKKRDEVQEDISSKSTILDLFRVIKQNKELLYAALGLILYYFGSFILTGIGQNYFYMIYGYGGNKGGMVATVISVVFVLSTIVAQAFYPMLIKKYERKKILTITGGVILFAYLAFFLVAFPIFGDKPLAYSDPSSGGMWFLGGTMFLYYLFSFLFFGGSGIYYLAILVMFQDSIDYNEWKFGERKESICFAWRPLGVKLASGLNRGLQFIVYAISGTSVYINAISTAEGEYNASYNMLVESHNGIASEISEAEIESIAGVRNTAIEEAGNKITRSNKVVFGIIVIGTIIIAFAASYILLRFRYKLDEKQMLTIVADLEKTHKLDEKKLENKSN